MNIGRRFQLEGPYWRTDVPWWKLWAGHGTDEYWNCSAYFRCALFGIVFFWDPHYQDKVEVPLYQPQEDEVAHWQQWFSAKFADGDDLWAS